MPLSRWKMVSREFELKNPWWTYRKDITLLPSGKKGEYHYVHVKGSSMVIPIHPDGTLGLVNQYRYLGDRESLEFPCGSVKEHSTYEETAAGELAEETGYSAGEMEKVGEFNPYNGVTDEVCRIFVARKLKPAEKHPDETEEFEQLRLTPAQIDAEIRKGNIWDGMTLAAWVLVRDRL